MDYSLYQTVVTIIKRTYEMYRNCLQSDIFQDSETLSILMSSLNHLKFQHGVYLESQIDSYS